MREATQQHQRDVQITLEFINMYCRLIVLTLSSFNSIDDSMINADGVFPSQC